MNEKIVATFQVLTKLMEAEANKGADNNNPAPASAPPVEQSPVSPPAPAEPAPVNQVMPQNPPVQAQQPLSLDAVKNMSHDEINANWDAVSQVLSGSDAPAQ